MFGCICHVAALVSRTCAAVVSQTVLQALAQAMAMQPHQANRI